MKPEPPRVLGRLRRLSRERLGSYLETQAATWTHLEDVMLREEARHKGQMLSDSVQGKRPDTLRRLGTAGG